MTKGIALHRGIRRDCGTVWKKAADEVFRVREAKSRRIEQLMDELFTIPPEDVGKAFKNIQSEFHGVVKPASEKTEAVLKAENIILKISLEMEI